MPPTSKDTLGLDEPPPQSFVFFLTNLCNGEAESALSYEMRELLKRLQEEAHTRNGPVKGKLKLLISFAVSEADGVGIAYDVSTAAPTRKTTPTACWLDKHGRLTDKNPKQLEMKGIRDVSAGRDVRHVNAPEAGPAREV